MSKILSPYVCPKCHSDLTLTHQETVVCSSGCKFNYDDKRNIIFFEKQPQDFNEYSIEKAAQTHDNALDWLMRAHHTTEESFRQDVLNILKLQKNQKVLVTGVGAGNDLPFIFNEIGIGGEVHAQDIAEQMLLAAFDRSQTKFGLNSHNLTFCLSDGVRLPYCDDYFDVVYHFGGINLFSDVRQGISEMDRVAKQGGRVVFGDEGLAEWLYDCELGKILIANNSLYECKVPLSKLPETARNVQLNWTINNCYYLVSFTSTKDPLPVNLDLHHKGSRGGSLRTRYFGLLEGVDPNLKNRLYKEAARLKMSRVDFIEKTLKTGLKDTN